jgi:hypothetical protein
MYKAFGLVTFIPRAFSLHIAIVFVRLFCCFCLTCFWDVSFVFGGGLM